jgi:hypothetical protein
MRGFARASRRKQPMAGGREDKAGVSFLQRVSRYLLADVAPLPSRESVVDCRKELPNPRRLREQVITDRNAALTLKGRRSAIGNSSFLEQLSGRVVGLLCDHDFADSTPLHCFGRLRILGPWREVFDWKLLLGIQVFAGAIAIV